MTDFPEHLKVYSCSTMRFLLNWRQYTAVCVLHIRNEWHALHWYASHLQYIHCFLQWSHDWRPKLDYITMSCDSSAPFGALYVTEKKHDFSASLGALNQLKLWITLPCADELFHYHMSWFFSSNMCMCALYVTVHYDLSATIGTLYDTMIPWSVGSDRSSS